MKNVEQDLRTDTTTIIHLGRTLDSSNHPHSDLKKYGSKELRTPEPNQPYRQRGDTKRRTVAIIQLASGDLASLPRNTLTPEKS